LGRFPLGFELPEGSIYDVPTGELRPVDKSVVTLAFTKYIV